ncbi:hypothetical protein [Aeromonas sp. s5]|uniref:hypothetical protein n=1 Tax=Aeromonas sp. s5 TaxID=3138487 RepID=UPI0034A4A176
MATIPTPVLPKTYTFLLAVRGCRVADLPHLQTLSTIAYSEAEARYGLHGLPLVFLSCRLAGKGVTA